ncbi:MAG: Dabb family protein [Bacteroidota bacterium]|nr:Dabb family protein [Bacteroidota bacterium]
MIKHIVMWRVKGTDEGQDPKESTKIMKEKLESLIGKIEGLVSLQVGINQNPGAEAYDITLITEHLTWDALQFYQDHPLHKEAGKFIGSVKKARAAVDFEF